MERSSTAMSDQGTPSTRWARRSTSATSAASPVGLVARRSSTEPGPGTTAGSGDSARNCAPSRPGGQPLRDRAAGGQQRAAGPAAGAQLHLRRRLAVDGGEGVGEAEDAAHVGAAEPVDRLVGVADRDEVAPVAGQRLQQAHLRGVGVLVLVDEHDRPRGPLAAAQVVVGLEQAGGGAHQPRVVEHLDGRVEVEARLVVVEEAADRHPVGPAVLAAERAQPLAVEPALLRAQQHVAQLLPEPAQPERGAQLVGPATRRRRPAHRPAGATPRGPAPDRTAGAARGRRGRRARGAAGRRRTSGRSWRGRRGWCGRGGR